jgi:hypothetical protein
MDEASCAYLLGLYLGDGHIVRGRRDACVLAIACSDDWPGLMAAARRALSAVMLTSSVSRVQPTGRTTVKSYPEAPATHVPAARAGPQHTSRNRAARMADVIVRKYPGRIRRDYFIRMAGVA